MNRSARAGGLADVTDLCAEGLERLPARVLERHARYVCAAQRPDGGYAGRRGESGLYYTSFGLRAAHLLRIEDPALWQAAAEYIASVPGEPTDVVGWYCLLNSVSVLRLHGRGLDAVEAICLPPPDGVYGAYLGALCRESVGQPVAEADVVQLVQSRRQADGGFADGAGERSGTNPTAAAVQLLAACGGPADDPAAAAFLASCQNAEGGLTAWPGAPCADLLSTFTGMVALVGMGRLRQLQLAPIARFTRLLLAEEGGFRGAAADDASDLEYTFYGLGVLGLLGSAAARADCSGKDCCC